jgi:hypothetical protein
VINSAAALVRQLGAAVVLRSVAHVLHQRGAHLLQLVDLLLLLVDALAQRVHHVLGVGQFDFDVDESVFSIAHGYSCQKAGIVPPLLETLPHTTMSSGTQYMALGSILPLTGLVNLYSCQNGLFFFASSIRP